MSKGNTSLDPIARRKLIFSLSQPTNPVPGGVLRHLERNGTPRSIQAWEKAGWISIDEGSYFLTEKGYNALDTNKAQRIAHFVEYFLPKEQGRESNNPGTWLR